MNCPITVIPRLTRDPLKQEIAGQACNDKGQFIIHY